VFKRLHTSKLRWIPVTSTAHSATLSILTSMCTLYTNKDRANSAWQFTCHQVKNVYCTHNLWQMCTSAFNTTPLRCTGKYYMPYIPNLFLFKILKNLKICKDLKNLQIKFDRARFWDTVWILISLHTSNVPHTQYIIIISARFHCESDKQWTWVRRTMVDVSWVAWWQCCTDTRRWRRSRHWRRRRPRPLTWRWNYQVCVLIWWTINHSCHNVNVDYNSGLFYASSLTKLHREQTCFKLTAIVTQSSQSNAVITSSNTSEPAIKHADTHEMNTFVNWEMDKHETHINATNVDSVSVHMLLCPTVTLIRYY